MKKTPRSNTFILSLILLIVAYVVFLYFWKIKPINDEAASARGSHIPNTKQEPPKRFFRLPWEPF